MSGTHDDVDNFRDLLIRVYFILRVSFLATNSYLRYLRILIR